MKFYFCKQLLLMLCLLCFAAVAVAQGSDPVAPEAPPARSLDRGTNQLGFWGGYSPDNPTLIGTTTGRPFGELNVQYARVLGTGNHWALKYTVELVPVAVISQPRQGTVAQGNFLVIVDEPGTRRWIYGAGITPIGLQLNFRRRHALQPYLNGTAGMLYFTSQVPVANSSQFNFTFGWGAGVELWHRENQSVRVGYKFHHISNANTGNPRNPGADSNLFYAGYAFSWKR